MFLVKQPNQEAVWLVVTGPKGRVRVHVTADQFTSYALADYGPVCTVDDVTMFGKVAG